ncbi:EHF [Mytilus edulis]|uniref:EHF n=1 Tax=Mytilus edulis TaxID=6550 RepID=A0A8S3R0R2_MYTED|nr:EHF [Mytilus edulis]
MIFYLHEDYCRFHLKEMWLRIKLRYCKALTYHTMPNMYHPESSDSTVCTEEPIDFLNEDGVSEELGPIPKVVPLYANEIKATEDFQKTTMHNSIFSSKQNRQNGNIRLWQFLLCLLTNLNFNPSHIKWTNRRSGEFKILRSKDIAHMWGEMKNNNRMTYEKMSRAMRNYYKDKILTPVPQRLVYKFGPMSDGW